MDPSSAGFGDRSLRAFRPTGVLGGDEADKRHRRRGGGEAARITELSGDGERREIVDAAKAAQALDAWAERFEVEQGAEILLDAV